VDIVILALISGSKSILSESEMIREK